MSRGAYFQGGGAARLVLTEICNSINVEIIVPAGTMVGRLVALISRQMCASVVLMIKEAVASYDEAHGEVAVVPMLLMARAGSGL